MKYSYSLVALLASILSHAQPNTEIFLFDLNIHKEGFELSNFKNISNNQGYDNQPSFIDTITLLYSGTRNGQTDIVKYNILDGTMEWLTDTQGSEYSPMKIPEQNAFSAIRLDVDGKQLLYSYDVKNKTSTPLMDTLVVGYHSWYDKNIIVSSVLEGEMMSLYVTNVRTNYNKKIETNVGRSLHKIPNTELVSYISKNKPDPWDIKSLDPISNETKLITRILPGIEDVSWLSDGSILMAKDGILFQWSKEKENTWNQVSSLKDYGITNITRLAVSPDGKKLALVGETIQELAPLWPQKKETQLITVKKASQIPKIDGLANESIWSETTWYPMDQTWVGAPNDPSDFQGRYQLTWTDDALYILAEITDDIIYDQNEDPLKLWWDDDCVEVFIDEDNSGGEHQYNHNAFAYHVALDGNVVDMSPEKSGKLYNNHVQSNHVTTGKTTIWELKFSLYDDSYIEEGNNKPVKLSAGKKIGFAIAYCDNDDSEVRENFIGSIPVEGEDKNRGWIDANIFGTLILKN